MKTSGAFSSHPEEEILDLFVMGRLKGSELESVKAHIEHCEECQVKALEFGEWVNTLRDAAREARSEEKYHAPTYRWFRKPVFLAAATLAVVATIAVPLMKGPAEAQSVELATFRGDGQSAGISTADAGRPLNLKIDLTGLPESNCCLIQIVDANGKTLSQIQATIVNGRTNASSQSLSTGRYWVRISTQNGEPLREMGLDVR